MNNKYEFSYLMLRDYYHINLYTCKVLEVEAVFSLWLPVLLMLLTLSTHCKAARWKELMAMQDKCFGRAFILLMNLNERKKIRFTLQFPNREGDIIPVHQI